MKEAVLGNTDINLFIILFLIVYNIRAQRRPVPHLLQYNLLQAPPLSRLQSKIHFAKL